VECVGLPGIEPGLHDPQPRVLPLYDSPFYARFHEIFGRGAGNRTRSLRTRSACTTGIRRPEQKPHAAQKRVDPSGVEPLTSSMRMTRSTS
jgi:hypothetical protein